MRRCRLAPRVAAQAAACGRRVAALRGAAGSAERQRAGAACGSRSQALAAAARDSPGSWSGRGCWRNCPWACAPSSQGSTSLRRALSAHGAARTRTLFPGKDNGLLSLCWASSVACAHPSVAQQGHELESPGTTAAAAVPGTAGCSKVLNAQSHAPLSSAFR